MARKDHLRFWIVAVTAFVGLVALWNSKLTACARSTEFRPKVKHLTKREVVENDSVVRKPRVYTEFVVFERASLYSDGDLFNTQPSAKCPVAVPSMLPCTCRSLARGIVVECTRPESRNALSNALSGLRDYVMSEAKLTELKFELSNEDFDPMQFLSLQFLRGEVRIRGAENSFSFAHDPRTKTALKSVHFVGTSIDLGDTTLAEAPSGLSALEFLEANFSTPYRPEWFAGLRVEQLRILDSPKITDPIAAGLVGLKVYQHSKCGLEDISEEFLPRDKSELRRLDFSINSLKTLPEGIFEGIPKLEEVLLVSNRFEFLDKNVFRPVFLEHRDYSFHRLDVNANYLLQCEGLEWIPTKEECEKVKGTCLHETEGDIDVSRYCVLHDFDVPPVSN